MSSLSFFRLPSFSYHLLLLSVWMIIPWSYLYAAYYLIISNKYLQHFLRRTPIATSKPSLLLFFYACAEVLFSIYYFYLTRKAQRRLPPVQHDPDFLRESLERVARTGLGSSDRTVTFIQPGYTQLDNLKTTCRRTVFYDLIDEDTSDRSSLSLSLSTSPSTPLDQVLPASDDGSLAKPLARDDPRAVDFRSQLVVWFGNCKWEDIHRENLIELLGWILFGRPVEELSSVTHHNLIEHITVLFEHRAGSLLPTGYHPHLKYRVMRITLDPIRVTGHPLSLYLYTTFTSWGVKSLMKTQGFVEDQCTKRPNGLRYLIRIPPGWDKTPIKDRTLPFIFIHGMALGLINYGLFFNYLCNSKWARNRPVMIPMQPSISQGFFDSQHFNPLSKNEMISDFNEFIEKFGFDQTGFEILGNSNGTMVAAWIIKSMKSLVKRVCLVDPVCFCLWEGHVCQNFLYSNPQSGLENAIRYFLATELGIAKSLHRHFDWPSNTLWPHELSFLDDPKLVSIFIAGQDTILNPKRIEKHLRDHGMTGKGLVVVQDAKHGQMMAEDSAPFRMIIKWLEGSE